MKTTKIKTDNDALKIMDKTEYRTIIKHYYLEGQKPKQIYAKMQEVYGISAPSHKKVQFWVAQFKRGRMNVQDAPRSGRPREELKPKQKLCPICGKTLSRTASLTEHMRVHTGERPYKCSTCDKAFARSEDRRRHELASHAESHMRNFGCEHCGKRFVSGSLLRIHRRIHVSLLMIQRFCYLNYHNMDFIQFLDG